MAVAVVAGLASTAGAYGTAVALSATFSLAWAGTAFAIGAGLSMISQALQPSLRVGQDTGLSTSVANPIAERPIVYGRTRTGGTIVYFTTSGADNKYLHLVIAVAGHAIDGYEKVYFDDEVIWEDGSYVDDWVQNAQINFYDGTQTTADQDLINASNEWNSNCILNDTAYIHVRLEYDPEVYTNGIPSITTTIRGKKVLDPRTDVTAWSENPALCIYDYLKDPKYGLNDDTVNEAQVIASANVCDQLVTIDTGVDQTRYALSGFISTGDTIKANLEKMLSSMFGKLVCSGGELFVNAGYYTSPVLDIDESLLVGAVSLQTKTSRRNVYNAVKGTFLSEEENYIFADYPSIKSDTYSTEDGEPLYLDLPLPCTTNNVRAQRLAKLSLNKSRQQRSLSIPVNLAGLKVRAGDVIRFTSERLGISNAEYEVIDFEFEYSDQLIVNLVCVETGSSLYDWTVADKLDFSVGSDITLYDGSAVAPTGLTATAVSDILSDGTDSTYIDVAWTNPSDIYFDYVVLKYGDQSIVTKDQTYRINNVDENTQYIITISAYNTFGRQSAGLSTNVTTVRDTTAPANITSITATGGLQTIDLSWTNPSDDDFDLVRIKVASTNSEPTGYSYEVRADNFIDDVGAYSATRYYWLAPVDRTGNVGNYVSGGSATTGSITINDIPQVAGTFYLTLGNDDAPTGTEFYTAVGRDPVDGDFAIVNKEFAFSYNGSAWTAVTEFIDGSLLVSQSITTLGDVTAGTFSLGSGKFTVDSSGILNATDAVIDGNVTAQSLDVENATVTGTFIAPIGWSDGVYNGVINRGNLNESVKDLIDERIAEVTGGISGDFGQDDGSFSYIAQGNPDPDNPIVLNITHENGKDLTVELSGSRSWNRQFIGLPDTDMGVTIILERSPAGADTWTTLTTLTDSGSSITTSGPTLIHSSTYAYSISIYHVLTDDQASGNYDYRARTTVAGSAYSVGVPIQLTVVEPATVGAGNADTLDNEDGAYYLNYNNFTNTPTIPSSFNILNGLGSYVWDATENARDWDSGLQLSFVQANDGYPSFGTVIRAKTYDNDGGNGEIYFPYSSSYGGDQLQYRVGKYNNAGMTSFRKIWDDNQFSSTDISNWDTAYGWGNHADAGYLTVESYENLQQLTFNVNQADSTTSSNYNIQGVKYSNGRILAVQNITGYTGNSTEFRWRFRDLGDASPSSQTLMSLTPTAFDSADLEVSGSITATGYNDSNWNTAYGWGDHASAGYLTTHQDISGKADLSGATFTGIITVEQGENDGLRVADNKIRSVGDGLVINSDGIRFGDTSANWDYDEWAGLKYYHPSKTIYFGGARASTSYWENNLGDANDTKIDFVGVTDLKHNGTTVIDSSRNIKNIGTVSSGVMYPKTTNGSAVGGGIFLAPEYNGTNPLTSDHIPVMSTSYSSGGLIIGYGAAGKAGSGTNTFTSTFDNFSGYRSAVKFLHNEVAFWGTTSATQTAVGSDLTMQQGLSINVSTGTIDVKHGGYQIGGTTVIDSSRNLTNIGTFQNGSMWVNDGSANNSYNENIRLFDPTGGVASVIAFGATGTSGSPRNSILSYNLAGYGLDFRKGNTRKLSIQDDVLIDNASLNVTSGSYKVSGTTVIDSGRNATFNSVTISTGNLNIRTQNEENPTDVIYLGANNGNSTGTSNDIGTGLVFAPQYSGYTKRSAGIMQIGEGNYFRSGLAFYTNNTSNATTDWSERMRLDMDGNLIIGQGSISYTINDNSPVVGSSTNNRLHVNGSIQLTNNNDAIVFGRGTSTFIKDEELGFGWGGGLYMTDGTWLRTRGNKGFYNGTGTIRTDGAFDIGGTTVINSSRNMYPNVIDMGSGHAQGYKFHGRSFSWNSAMQSPTTKMPHIWQENYSGWDPILGIKTYNGFWQMGAYSSNKIHFGYMAGAYGTHGTNGFDTSIAISPTQFKVGDVGSMSIVASGNITAYSDARLKDNVKTLDGSKVYQMRGVSFTKDGELGSGVIAQEMEQIAPELVLTNDDEMQTKSVAYGNVVGYLIEAIKELKAEIEELKK